MNILVVEDHDDLRDATVFALSAKGHVVRGVACAEEIDDELGVFRPDLLVLDLNLPGEDGLSVARRMRAADPAIGIIMVTARDTPKDVMQGYGSGADIFVAKPTSPDELDAAIRALARRLAPAKPAAVALNTQLLQLKGSRGAVDVSSLESNMLVCLARARDARLETWQLLELSGRNVDDQEKRALAVQIVRLRKKLVEVGAPEPTLKAIRGTGYQLCVAIEIERE